MHNDNEHDSTLDQTMILINVYCNKSVLTTGVSDICDIIPSAQSKEESKDDNRASQQHTDI